MGGENTSQNIDWEDVRNKMPDFRIIFLKKAKIKQKNFLSFFFYTKSVIFAKDSGASNIFAHQKSRFFLTIDIRPVPAETARNGLKRFVKPTFHADKTSCFPLTNSFFWCG
jgi:hypothetical protein